MPESGEYKSVVGIDQIYYALVSQDNASGYEAGTPAILAPAVKIPAEPTT
jgi:hypothetical protein